jgi:hypothetical protein
MPSATESVCTLVEFLLQQHPHADDMAKRLHELCGKYLARPFQKAKEQDKLRFESTICPSSRL